jgi:hypothetical protein
MAAPLRYLTVCVQAAVLEEHHGAFMRALGRATSWLVPGGRFGRRRFVANVIAASLAEIGCTTNRSLADEGGVGFWVPGFFGSLAATPQVLGFSFGNLLYYSQVSAGGNVAFAKQVPLDNINVNFNGNFNANVHGSAEPLYMAAPRYTFATPVFSGQANVSLAIPYGRTEASVDATIMGNLGLGGPGFAVGRSLTQAITGICDMSPMASLRWNFGVNNFMTYLTGNLTTGRYDQGRGSSISVSAIMLSMRAAPIPTLTRRLDANSPPHLASLTTSKTSTPTIRTASTCIWIGVHRNS